MRIMPTKCTCTRSHLCVNACSCEKLLGSSNSGGELNADPAVSQTLNDWRSNSRNASALSQAGVRADHDKQRIRRRMSSRCPLMPLSRRQVLAGCDGRFGNAQSISAMLRLPVDVMPTTAAGDQAAGEGESIDSVLEPTLQVSWRSSSWELG